MPNPNRKKRSIWFWLLMTCIVLAIVGLPTGYFGLRYYIKQRIIGWRADGMAAAEAGNNEKAAQFLALYIQRRPGDLQALETYIKVREKVEMANGQHIAETVAALKMVLGLDPDRIEDRRHLLRLYAAMQRRPEALDTANALLGQIARLQKVEIEAGHPEKAKALNPMKAETLGIKADVLVGMQEPREALAVVEEWIAVAQDTAGQNIVEPQMKRIDIRLRLGQSLDGIIKEMQSLTDARPGDPGAKLLLGYAFLYSGEPKLQDTAQWLRSAARDVDPKSPLAKTIVEQFDKLGISAEAIAAMQDLVDRGAGVEIRHTLACRYWEQGKWQKCAELLADVNPADSDADAELLAFKEISLSNLSKSEEAAACRAALAKKKTAMAQAWMLILPRVTSAAEVNNQRVVEGCRQALVLNPQDRYLYYYMGDAFHRMGELDLAIDSWRQALAYGPTWDVPVPRLVDALLLKGQTGWANQLARSANIRNPTAATSIALARAWAVGLETGDVTDTESLVQWAEKVQAAAPEEEQSLLISVRQHAKGGKSAEAVDAIRKAIQRTPAPREALFISLAAISTEFKLGIQEEILSASEKAHGASEVLAYARATLAFQQGNADAGRILFEQAAANPARTGEAVNWKLAQALYLDISNDDKALAAWQKLGNEYPDNLAVQRAIAAARTVAGHREVMSPAVERLKAINEGKGLEWRLAEGRMLVSCAKNEDDFAKTALVLSDLCKDYSGLPEAHVLLAQALVKMNRMEGAVEHMRLAAQLDPNSARIAVQLSTILLQRGDFAGAQQELERVMLRLRDPKDRRMAAVILAQTGAADKAVALMQQPGAGGSQTAPTDDLLMAELLRKNGQLDQAEAIVKSKLDNADLAMVRFAAGLYMEMGRRADAEKALERLDALKLEPALKEMIWGSYYLQTGRPAEAIAQYQAAVKQAPTNGVTWRTLAAIYMVLGKRDEAMTAIRDGAKAAPADQELQAEQAQVDLIRESLEDPVLANVVMIYHRNPLTGEAPLEMMRLVTDARRANDSQRLAARLQQFIERHTNFMPAYIRLAQCFAEMGRTNDALTAAQNAMNVFPNEPEPARVAAQVAAVSQKWSDMRSAAEAWKKRSGNDINADISLARALTGLGQYDAARTQMRPFVAAAKQGNPERFATALAVYAAATVNLGNEQEAIDLLWPLAQKDARWRQVWVDTSLLFKNPKETIAWLEKVEMAIPANAPTERMGIVEALDILGRREKNDDLLKRATDMSIQVADQAPKNLVAQLTAAAQAERMGNSKAAEDYYRRSLGIDPTIWIANNNLAMIVLRRDGDAREAVSFAEAALKSNPRSANIYDTLALAQAKAGNPKSATATIRVALNLAPDNLPYQVRLAQYLMDSGQNTEAVTKLREIDQSGQPGDLDNATKKILEDLRKKAQLNG